jgi:hypothetical protein
MLPKLLQTKTSNQNGDMSSLCPEREESHLVLTASEASSRGLGVSMDAPFHGGTNDTISGHVRLMRPKISPFPFNILLSVAAPRLHGGGVLVLAALQTKYGLSIILETLTGLMWYQK